MYRLAALVLLVSLAAVQAPLLHAAERVALVIGNGKYEHATELPNPSNDAEEMASVLSGLGFQVIKGIDLDRSGMEGKIREFAQAVRPAKLALFFYAGHGMQVNGRNFLIPIDAELADSTALDFEAVDADQVFRYMGSADRVALAFLDACRNNPLARRFARTLGPTRSASVGDGLAAPSTTGTGLFIAFATAPNDVALDGEGINSPFTQALLKHLPSPGLEIQHMMTRVKADVWQATAGDQQPWHSSDLRSDVYLLPDQTADPEQHDPVAADFEIARNINTREAWEAYLARHGDQQDSFYVQLGEAALKRIAIGNYPPVDDPDAAEVVPNSPLPTDVLIDLETLNLVESHPFFAEAPRMLLSSYSVATSYEEYGSRSVEKVDLHQVRRNVLERRTLTEYSEPGVGGGIYQSRQDSKALYAFVVGIFELGMRVSITNTQANESSETTPMSSTTRLEQLTGKLFPVTIGNRFTYRSRTSFDPVYGDGELIHEGSCEVTKKLPANKFHHSLTGDALILECVVVGSFTKRGDKHPHKQSHVFIDSLGVFIPADALDPDVHQGTSEYHRLLTDVDFRR